MAKAKTNLVIVESPAKAKTIEKYLGADFKVIASMGHLRDLPKSKIGVATDADFEPEYVPVKGRESIISDMKKNVKNANIVYLATDPDREGEAISWHLKELLELPDEKARRVTFNEITKKVVTESIEKPRGIDYDLVNAQQARRILDRLVGYKLSPMLWHKLKKPKLSAGRVQSVATRMVVDREDEIRAFIPVEIWSIDGVFKRREKDGSFTARFHASGGKKTELHSEEQVKAVLADVEGNPFEIASVKRGEKYRSPSPPFITSSLQQEASRRLGMTPSRTMSIAQQLYEGIEIAGEGTVGLITYMRTDSLRLSDEAMAAAKGYIISNYGDKFYFGQPRVFKGKASAQDAHEAIRPSMVELSPERVKKDLTGDQYRLYRLIWMRFTASQMANAIYDNVVIDAACNGHVFRANHTELKFAGYTAVYEESRDEEEPEIKKPLPNLNEGEIVDPQKFTSEQKFTQPPPRYTEATLVRAMEEKGIGRPSTYAPTISTIVNREYAVKEGKHLRPTPLGETVTKLMREYFQDIVDLKFTATLEDSLDEVERGDKKWRALLHDFYGGFDKELQHAEQALDGVFIKIPDELSDEKCDECGKQMVVKFGRFGRFLACPGYPDCTFTKPIVIEMPGRCPKCDSRILKRTSRNGHVFYACEKGADCGFMTWHVPVKDFCPECGKTLFKLSGKGQKKLFCTNEACEAFLPEDRRGYKKKPAAKAEGEDGEKAAETAEKPEKKPAKSKTSAAKKPAAKKTATKKPATKKPAAKKTAAKTKSEKPDAKKPATTKKPAAKKNDTAAKDKEE